MADSDIQFKLLSESTLKPDLIDAGNSIRRARHALANINGETIDPATNQAVLDLGTALENILDALTNVLNVTDANAAPVAGFLPISTPGRGWGVNITTGGWVTVTAADNTTADKYLPAEGNWEFSDSVKNVVPHATKTPKAVIDGVYGRK